MTRIDPSAPDGPPSTAEIAALTARLRDLSGRALTNRPTTDAERAEFLADKDALLARVPDDMPTAAVEPQLAGHVDFGLPAEMVDGIEERRTAPARPDHPAELSARLADLRARATEAARGVEGAKCPFTRWKTVSAAQAARELAARGADLATAQAAVAGYLHDTSERVGAPADEWGLDQGDIDAIATAYRLPAAEITGDLHEADDVARAAQLTRWHADDHSITNGNDDGHDDSDGAGRAR